MKSDDHDVNKPVDLPRRSEKPRWTQFGPTGTNKKRFKHYARNFLIVNWKMLLAISAVFIISVPLIISNLGNDAAVVDETKSATEKKIERFYELCQLDDLNNSASGVAQLDEAIRLGNELEASGKLPADQLQQMKSARLTAAIKTCSLASKLRLPSLKMHQQKLESYCRAAIKSDDREFSSRAHERLCTNLINRYLEEPTLEKLTAIEKQATESLAILLARSDQLDLIVFALKRLGTDKSSFRKRTQELLVKTGNQCKSSENPNHIAIGSTIHDQLILRGRNINELCFKASIKDQTEAATVQLKDFSSDVANAEFKSDLLYHFVFKAIDTCDRSDRKAIAQVILNNIESTIEEIEPESVKSKAKLGLANYKRRASNVIDSEFDLSRLEGVDARFPVFEKFKDKPVVIFFYDISPNSQFEMRALVSYKLSNISNRNLEYMIVSVPQNVAEFNWAGVTELVKSRQQKEAEFEEGLGARFPRIFHVPSAKAHLVRDQIPALSAPYMVILDSDHKVHATNITAAGLPKIMKKLEE